MEWEYEIKMGSELRIRQENLLNIISVTKNIFVIFCTKYMTRIYNI